MGVKQNEMAWSRLKRCAAVGLSSSGCTYRVHMCLVVTVQFPGFSACLTMIMMIAYNAPRACCCLREKKTSTLFHELTQALGICATAQGALKFGRVKA